MQYRHLKTADLAGWEHCSRIQGDLKDKCSTESVSVFLPSAGNGWIAKDENEATASEVTANNIGIEEGKLRGRHVNKLIVDEDAEIDVA